MTSSYRVQYRTVHNTLVTRKFEAESHTHAQELAQEMPDFMFLVCCWRCSEESLGAPRSHAGEVLENLYLIICTMVVLCAIAFGVLYFFGD